MENNSEINSDSKFDKLIHNKKFLIIAGIVATIILILIIAIPFINRGNKKPEEGETYQKTIDPISGETIHNIKQESEPSGDDELITIGFHQLVEFGMANHHYNQTIKSVKEYLTKNYPSAKRANYKKDSFKYVDPELYVVGFNFVIDTGETFYITVDSKNTIDENHKIKDAKIVIEQVQ